MIEARHNRMYDEAHDSTILGCRVAASGQTSIWGTLPGDGMGSILDPDDLTQRLSGFLRTAGAAMSGDAQQLAMAVGIGQLTGITEGRITGVPRTRASGFPFGRDRIAVPPDEAVSRAALSNGARDAAGPSPKRSSPPTEATTEAASEPPGPVSATIRTGSESQPQWHFRRLEIQRRAGLVGQPEDRRRAQ